MVCHKKRKKPLQSMLISDDNNFIAYLSKCLCLLEMGIQASILFPKGISR